jgi:hypothetical protein
MLRSLVVPLTQECEAVKRVEVVAVRAPCERRWVAAPARDIHPSSQKAVTECAELK